MKPKASILCALILAVTALAGCATVRGIGEDIQSLGRGIKRTLSNAE
jgi:predicted small secreted protein